MVVFMIQPRALTLCLVVAMSVGPCLAVQPQEPQTQPKSEVTDQPLVTAAGDYLIQPGDVLSIRVFQQPELSGDFKVSAQGLLRLLYLDEPIKAAGLTEWQLADVIQKAYATLLRDPRVSVQAKDARQAVAYILGQVQSPGPVPWTPGTRLLNMIAAARGLNERAGNVVFILRNTVWSAGERPENQTGETEVKLTSVLETVDVRQMLLGNVELNRLINPGDIVSVPEVDRVFVGGGVNSPGAFELRGDLRLSQVLTLAGGLKTTSKKKVTIIRRQPGKPGLTEILVDVEAMMKDRSKDIAMEANDLVFVPSSVAKSVGLALLNAFAFQSAVQLPFYLLTGRR